MKLLLSFFIFFTLSLGSCIAPRAVINSGKVTPKGEVKAGLNFSGNIPTQTVVAIADLNKSVINSIVKKDTVLLDQQINNFAKALISYAIDPASTNFDFYIRYGLVDKIDVGYKYSPGVHAFDVMFQFLGSTGSLNNPGKDKLYGSTGLQFSRQKSDLPDKLFLDKLSLFFDFRATRTDLMIPLIFSYSFGEEEKFGNVSYGLVYNRTYLTYGYEPTKLFKQVGSSFVQVNPLIVRNNFGSLGGFVNGKIGFKNIYLLPALAVYHQSIKELQMPGENTIDLSGFTVIPSVGIQFHSRKK